MLSPPSAELNFQVCSYQAVEGDRSYRMFDMILDGFTLLAMGFTGTNGIPPAIRNNPQPGRHSSPSWSPSITHHLW